ncbi:hypothetical protein FJ365_03285 [Candidatus Dependentiae bacterium]|nr:hypothetical protein [Candidatus Dependentiae bacterium]
MKTIVLAIVLALCSSSIVVASTPPPTTRAKAFTREGLEQIVRRAEVDKPTQSALLKLISTHPIKCTTVVVAVVLAVCIYAKAIGVAIVSTAIIAIIIDLACDDSYINTAYHRLATGDTLPTPSKEAVAAARERGAPTKISHAH